MFKELPPEIQRILRQQEVMQKHMPWTMRFLQKEGVSFRGLSIFPSDRGGYAVAVRQYRSDGQPVVGYGNGTTPFEAFQAVETILLLDKTYPDKNADDYDSSLPAKLP